MKKSEFSCLWFQPSTPLSGWKFNNDMFLRGKFLQGMYLNSLNFFLVISEGTNNFDLLLLYIFGHAYSATSSTRNILVAADMLATVWLWSFALCQSCWVVTFFGKRGGSVAVF